MLDVARLGRRGQHCGGPHRRHRHALGIFAAARVLWRDRRHPRSAYQLRDGAGQPRAGLNAVDINSIGLGAVLLYVPDVKLFDGSIGFLGTTGVGQVCGQIVSTSPSRCRSGIGDSYVEMFWSRFYGFTRPSPDKTALPIREGLAVGAGLGAVLPFGPYDAIIQASNGVTVGSNTLIVAPSVAFTYTTPPLIAEGTEFSSKIYLNNYSTNSDTNYKSGSNIVADFAVSERIGRWQLGVAGYYLRQFEDDQRAGVRVAPDGRRAEVLEPRSRRQLRHPRSRSVHQVQGAELRVCLQHGHGHIFRAPHCEEIVLATRALRSTKTTGCAFG